MKIKICKHVSVPHGPASYSTSSQLFHTTSTSLAIPLQSARRVSIMFFQDTNLGPKFLLPVSLLPFGLFHGETNLLPSCLGHIRLEPKRWYLMFEMVFVCTIWFSMWILKCIVWIDIRIWHHPQRGWFQWLGPGPPSRRLGDPFEVSGIPPTHRWLPKDFCVNSPCPLEKPLKKNMTRYHHLQWCSDPSAGSSRVRVPVAGLNLKQCLLQRP